MVRQHLEPGLLQPLSALAQQQHVLEDATGETHQPHLAGNEADDLRNRIRDRVVEARRQHLRFDTGAQCRHHCPHHAGRVDDSVFAHVHSQLRRVRTGRVGQHLEFDSGLALVVDSVPHPEQGGDGVEQPAHARTRHTAGSVLQLRTNEP
jgi:hypothetical protein